MSWLSDAHTEWHAVNGKNVVCPLDCGVGEDVADQYEQEEDQPPIILDEYWKDRDEFGPVEGGDPWASGARVDW